MLTPDTIKIKLQYLLEPNTGSLITLDAIQVIMSLLRFTVVLS